MKDLELPKKKRGRPPKQVENGLDLEAKVEIITPAVTPPKVPTRKSIQCLADIDVTKIDSQKIFTRNMLNMIDKAHPKISLSDKIKFIHKCSFAGANPSLDQAYLIERGGRATITFNYHFMIAKVQATNELECLIYETNLEDVFDPFKNKTEKQLVATVTVRRKGQVETISKAYWNEFAGTTHTWKRMPRLMLEKCGIVHALRKSFADILGGMYVPEEMNEVGRSAKPDKKPDLSRLEI